jgi:hypothetical protein
VGAAVSCYGVTFGPEKRLECRFQELCDKLLLACNGYRLDDASGALASTLITVVISATPDREEADLVLGRLVEAMRGHIRDMARPRHRKA